MWWSHTGVSEVAPGAGMGSRFAGWIGGPRLSSSPQGDRRQIPPYSAAGGSNVVAMGESADSDPSDGTEPGALSVVIADDHAVVRTGLSQLLSAMEDVSLVGTASDGREAVELCIRSGPDVVLMDLEMPLVDGIEATRRIKAERPASEVVILPSYSARARILRALDAGAAGYLLKDVEPDDLGRAIRAAAAGDAPLDPKAARALLSSRSATWPGDGLSPREREVLLMVAKGQPNKVIARTLGLSEKTVKTHLTSVFRQLGVTDRTQAALWAVENGLGPEA
mgnify:CR=1 FL=1